MEERKSVFRWQGVRNGGACITGYKGLSPNQRHNLIDGFRSVQNYTVGHVLCFVYTTEVIVHLPLAPIQSPFVFIFFLCSCTSHVLMSCFDTELLTSIVRCLYEGDTFSAFQCSYGTPLPESLYRHLG